MNKSITTAQARMALTLFVLGGVCVLTGIAFDAFTFFPAINGKIITGIGVLLGGVSFAYIVRYLAFRKDPTTALRMEISERDERTLSIRRRAGNNAFITAMILSGLTLIIYSLVSYPILAEQINFDWVWLMLAVQVIVPMLVYIIGLVHYHDTM
ncbi:MAG TPA: hypothetical protein VN376_08105 [Longilinea sp.]|nr:hypothetical protein [Longilinea sp.]